MSDNTNDILQKLKEKFKDNFIKVKDKLNQKQSLFDGIFQWNKKYWEPATIKTQLIEALTSDELSGKKQDDLLQMFIESITLTKNIHGTDETDRDCENLICTPNGIIDLEALKKYGIDHQEQWLKPHVEYKNRYITMCTQANYKPETEQNLDFFYYLLEKDLLRFDEELQKWFRSFLGDLLLGKNNSQQFVLFLGKTRSGKTTLLNFITSILGSYAFAISNDILSKEDDDLRKTLYRKRKCRLLHHDDPGKKKIDVAATKRITGDSKISVNGIEFRVPAHLIINSNDMPKSNSNDESKLIDEAFIERMVPIPFGNTIPESERNMDMENKLTQYRDDVFSLMVSSFYQFPINGVKKPAIAHEVIKKYKMFNDPVKAFYDTYCKKTPAVSPIKATELYQHFCPFYSIYHKASIEPEVNDFKTQLEIEGIFLFDEDVLKTVMSQTDFNSCIKAVHPDFKTGNELTLQGIAFKKDKPYWGNILDGKWDSPAIQANEAVLEGLNHAKGQIKTVHEPEKHQEKLNEQIQQQRHELQQQQWKQWYGCDYWCIGRDSTQCMKQNLCIVRQNQSQWMQPPPQWFPIQNQNPSVSTPTPQTQEQETSPKEDRKPISKFEYATAWGPEVDPYTLVDETGSVIGYTSVPYRKPEK